MEDGTVGAVGTYLLVAAAGVVSILLGLCQVLIVLLGLAGSQLRRIGMLGCLMRLGVGMAPCILLTLQHGISVTVSIRGAVTSLWLPRNCRSVFGNAQQHA